MKILLGILSSLTLSGGSVSSVAIVSTYSTHSNLQNSKNLQDIINLETQFQGYFPYTTENVPSEFQFEVSTNFNEALVDQRVDEALAHYGAFDEGILFQGFLEQYVQAGYIKRMVYDYQTGQTTEHIVPHGLDENAFYGFRYIAQDNPYDIEIGSELDVIIESGHGGLVDISNAQRYIDEAVENGAKPFEFKNIASDYDLSKEQIAMIVDNKLRQMGVEGSSSSSRYSENYLFNLMKEQNIDIFFVNGTHNSHIPFIPQPGETLFYTMHIRTLVSGSDIFVDDKEIVIPLIVSNDNVDGYDISQMQDDFDNYTANNDIVISVSSMSNFSIDNLIVQLDDGAKAAQIETEYGNFPLNFFQSYFGEPNLTYSFNGKDNSVASLNWPEVYGQAKNFITFKTIKTETATDLMPEKE